MEKVKIMLDNIRYDVKPFNPQKISNSLVNREVDIDLPSLAYALSHGQSFVACLLGKNALGEKKRAKSSWKSQQVICLDFDTGMTLDYALNEFKDQACFIYTTFSHTEELNKFRVVFVLDRVLYNYDELTAVYDYMLIKYPQADSSCRDGARIFYGGRKLYELNYTNRLNTKNIVDEYNDSKGVQVIVLKTLTTLLNGDAFTIDDYSTIYEGYSDRLRIMDVDYIRQINSKNEGKLTFYTNDEVYDYLKKQDLKKLLNLQGEKFNCIFHPDDNPSATILTVKETGHQFYKCHSSNCGFGTGAIIKCIENITGQSKYGAIEYLKNIYNIELAETEWQKTQKNIISTNIDYLTRPDFAEEYPVQYKLIKNYIPNLITFLTLARNSLPPEHYTEEQSLPIFYTTMDRFATLCNQKDSRRIVDRLALFTFLYYVCKLKYENIPPHLLDGYNKYKNKEIAERKKDSLGNTNTVYNFPSFFEIYEMNDETLNMSEKKAQEYYDKGLTMKAWGYELLYRSFNKEEADRVYPQLAKTEISEVDEKIAMDIEKKLMNEIKNKKFVIEKDFIARLSSKFDSKIVNQRKFKQVIGEVMDKYDLKRNRLTKEQKELYGLKKIPSSPYIIFK